MKRRQFIKTSVLTSLSAAIVPQFAFQTEGNVISYDQLIGKGNPTLIGTDFKLRAEAYSAFLKLRKAALKSNINIQVVSSYRSYSHQNRIWERKYNQNINMGLTSEESINKIIEYSTIPGTSRHHWATDLDIIDGNVAQPTSVLQPKHFEGNGCYRKLKLWMDIHANSFGFYLVYTDEPNRKGFKYEPWHYSYCPLSKAYLEAYRKLDLRTIIKKEQLMGNASFSDQFITNYINENILDINPELL